MIWGQNKEQFEVSAGQFPKGWSVSGQIAQSVRRALRCFQNELHHFVILNLKWYKASRSSALHRNCPVSL